AAICFGESHNLNAGTFNAYNWSTGATTQLIDVNTTGTYAVTVTDGNGCENSDSFVLTVNALPIVNLGADAAICFGESHNLNAGTFNAYNWSTGATTQLIDVNTAGTYAVTVTDGNGCENSDSFVLTVNALPIVNLGADAVICFGESHNLDAGTFNAYNWSTGATTQLIDVNTAGTYAVTVTDGNGCENNDSFVLTVNALPIVNLGADAAICFGESHNLDAGTFNAYNWSTGATTQLIDVNTTGTYAVTVTDGNGCENSDSFDLTVNDLPIVNLGADTTICNGSTYTLDAGLFASFLWSSGEVTQTLDVNTLGNYAVTVTDANSCTASDDINIELSVIIVLPGEVTICEGDFTSIDASGFESYLWSNGSTSASVIISEAGVYSVTVTDILGCLSSDTIELTVNPSPIIDLGGDTLVYEPGTPVVLNPGSFTTYSWSTSETTPTITVTTDGTYAVTVTNEFDCPASDSVVINFVGIADVAFETALVLYPNPTNSYLNVKADGYRMDRIVVYNAIGEAIIIQSVSGNEARIDVSKLPAGIFFLNVISTENKAAMKSFKVVR
ncbi:MAG: T9SS type A sorting domain-containing protein, partial [Bacteroidales bacterium]|nr:T9SS type A sorting domain-containing protein [Bacteroidales bacterium]